MLTFADSGAERKFRGRLTPISPTRPAPEFVSPPRWGAVIWRRRHVERRGHLLVERRWREAIRLPAGFGRLHIGGAQ